LVWAELDEPVANNFVSLVIYIRRFVVLFTREYSVGP